MNTPAEAAYSRVVRGASLLDSLPEVPVNWRALIDVDSLNMASMSNCVLGFIFKNNSENVYGFEYASEFTSLKNYLNNTTTYNSIDYGFARGDSLHDSSYVDDDTLIAAWATFLKQGNSMSFMNEIIHRRYELQLKITQQMSELEVTKNKLNNSENTLAEFDKVLSVFTSTDDTSSSL